MTKTATQAAFVAARIVAALVGLFAARAVTAEHGGVAVLGLTMAGLSLGLWMLWPWALRVGTVILLLAAVITPLGMINPFYASDAAAAGDVGPGFVLETIAVALGTSVLFGGLAWLMSQARLARERESGR